MPSRSEISEITSIKKEDVISTLQYLNLINYYKVGPGGQGTGTGGARRGAGPLTPCRALLPRASTSSRCLRTSWTDTSGRC